MGTTLDRRWCPPATNRTYCLHLRPDDASSPRHAPPPSSLPSPPSPQRPSMWPGCPAGLAGDGGRRRSLAAGTDGLACRGGLWGLPAAADFVGGVGRRGGVAGGSGRRRWPAWVAG
ncbi:hypothetical protein I4F81_000910 [Pyropia yezoensis]|uniref:Uncharacterized protein n=1 Tax=Pyropia yezoensis TaxID=2788 RepID=A0ACC3BK33_PYRYE|nr:hypothetical protein I4F81_000910 [Neopyropia yezoensis]